MGSYPDLAAFMARYPEAMIFRTFEDLNLRNLLYLQAELAHLESDSTGLARSDESSTDPKRRMNCRSWARLSRRMYSADGPGRESPPFGAAGEARTSHFMQWQKALEVREKLNLYNQALIQQSQLQTLPKAGNLALDRFRAMLQAPELGNNFLSGYVEDVWDAGRKNRDYVNLAPHCGEGDTLTRQLSSLTLYLKTRFQPALSEKVHHVPESTLAIVVDTASSVVSSLLPVLAIFALFFIDDLKKRLATILVFTMLFSLVLSRITRARRVEIFAATTAFAAAQAIFVGSDHPGGCNLAP